MNATSGMSAELEERILFVLSALEDANDALDKCDRLISSKKKSSEDKSQQGIHVEPVKKELNGAQAHKPHTSRKDQKQQLRQQREYNHKNNNNNNNEENKLSSYFDIKTTSEEGQEPVSHKVSAAAAAAKGKKTKAVQTDFSLRAPTTTTSSSATAASTKRQQQPREKQKSQSHSCKCNQGTVCIVRRKGQKKLEDIDVTKLIDSIKGSNEEQWKHVRQFIRQVLLAELEQEKWTRKSTEELNTRLSRQNQQLRAKLQEKRDERAKLDEEIQAMKSKFKSKSKVQDENQQLVLSKCEETFEKLNRLHQDLDGIQKKLVEDLDQSSISNADSPRSERNGLEIAPQLLLDQSRFSTSTQEWSDIQRELMRERILHEYYPMMAESRFVMEKLLSSIGIRISRLIELNTRSNLEAATEDRLVSCTHDGINDYEVENDEEEDLVRLFSKELQKSEHHKSKNLTRNKT